MAVPRYTGNCWDIAINAAIIILSYDLAIIPEPTRAGLTGSIVPFCDKFVTK